jgi:hypothetical protein
MAEQERGMSDDERIYREKERVERDALEIGPGLGGGLSPMLPTDVEGDNPDAIWEPASSDEQMAAPNWAHEEIEPGRENLERVKEPLQLSHDTHIISVFGENLGRVEEVYGYSPTNDPSWAAIKEGDRKLLVPVMSGQMEDDGLHVPYPKNLVESAPQLPEEFSLAQEMALYSHYNERRILPAADGYTQDQERTLHRLSHAA